MTLLMVEGVTFSQENEPLPPCNLSRKSSFAAFSTRWTTTSFAGGCVHLLPFLDDLPRNAARGLDGRVLSLPIGVDVGVQGKPPQHGGYHFNVHAVPEGCGGEDITRVPARRPPDRRGCAPAEGFSCPASGAWAQCSPRRGFVHWFVITGRTNAEYANFLERTAGKIAPGYQADLAVLSGDPLTTPAEELERIQVLQTYKRGQLIYDRGGT